MDIWSTTDGSVVTQQEYVHSYMATLKDKNIHEHIWKSIRGQLHENAHSLSTYIRICTFSQYIYTYMHILSVHIYVYAHSLSTYIRICTFHQYIHRWKYVSMVVHTYSSTTLCHTQHKRSLYGGGGGAQEVTAWRWGWGLVQCHKTAETGKRNSVSKQVATSWI
jgi:hypothetical protein